jgi:N-glycosylase/DNA lyase
MSLDHSVAIPVDTHVFQIAKASYVPHLSQTKSVTDKVYKENQIQNKKKQVLFSADLRHLKAEPSPAKKRSREKSQDVSSKEKPKKDEIRRKSKK